MFRWKEELPKLHPNFLLFHWFYCFAGISAAQVISLGDGRILLAGLREGRQGGRDHHRRRILERRIDAGRQVDAEARGQFGEERERRVEPAGRSYFCGVLEKQVAVEAVGEPRMGSGGERVRGDGGQRPQGSWFRLKRSEKSFASLTRSSIGSPRIVCTVFTNELCV